MANLQLPFGIEVLNQKPADAKYFLSGETPYNNVAEVNTKIVSGIRHQGLTVNILGTEYWYKDGIADVDLIEKSGGVSSVQNVGLGTGEIYSGTSGNTIFLRTIVGSGSTTVETVGNVVRVYSVSGGNRDVTDINAGTSYTANTNSDYLGISNSSMLSLYLPLSPATGQEITISDEFGLANTFPITIYGNGKDIDDSPTALINTDYGSITIVYNGNFWKVISFSN